jgi:hypothetical protein
MVRTITLVAYQRDSFTFRVEIELISMTSYLIIYRLQEKSAFLKSASLFTLEKQNTRHGTLLYSIQTYWYIIFSTPDCYELVKYLESKEC